MNQIRDNSGVHEIVDNAVYWTVYWSADNPTWRVVDPTVCDAVHLAVHRSVGDAMGDVVGNVVFNGVYRSLTMKV